MLWSVCQRYNLKAIHNRLAGFPLPPFVVIGMSKIQSESNSQLILLQRCSPRCCDRYVKATIWTGAKRSSAEPKQFTTGRVGKSGGDFLFPTYSHPLTVSNHVAAMSPWASFFWGWSYNLNRSEAELGGAKAIHNRQGWQVRGWLLVSDI
jgi:hypothetical protein